MAGCNQDSGYCKAEDDEFQVMLDKVMSKQKDRCGSVAETAQRRNSWSCRVHVWMRVPWSLLDQSPLSMAGQAQLERTPPQRHISLDSGLGGRNRRLDGLDPVRTCGTVSSE